MGFCALGLGFMKKNNRKMGMGFQFEQHRLGLWDLSWDLKKTISWEMGLGPPLHDLHFGSCLRRIRAEKSRNYRYVIVFRQFLFRLKCFLST